MIVIAAQNQNGSFGKKGSFISFAGRPFGGFMLD